MIDIKVGGKPLFIPEDTAIVFEQSNYTLSEEEVAADIVYSFEIPAAPNAAVLGNVQYSYVSGRRRYDCELSADGIPFSRGELYVQSSVDQRRLTCGVVCNAFGVGFGSRMLAENEYGPDIVISESEATHQASWREFLLGSLDSESVYKFFLFVDSRFYSDNEDYGFYNNKVSPLAENASDKLTTAYVNRLFFKPYKIVHSEGGTALVTDPTLFEASDTALMGCHLFNKQGSGKQNGFCFAPAIRLDWMVRKVFEAAGVAVSGSFFGESKIKRLFSQSMCALDGSSTQYGAKNWLEMTESDGTGNEDETQQFSIGRNKYTSFKRRQFSRVPSANFSLQLPQDSLARNGSYSGEETFSVVDEIFAIAFIPKSGASLPSWRMSRPKNAQSLDCDKFVYGERLLTKDEVKKAMGIASSSNPSSIDSFDEWGYATFNYTAYIGTVGINRKAKCVPIKKSPCSLLQLTPSAGQPTNYMSEGYIRGHIKTFADCLNAWGDALGSWQGSAEFTIKLVKCKVASSNKATKIRLHDYGSMMNAHISEYGQLEKIYDYEFLDNMDVALQDPTLNIFSNVLHWQSHMPNLSNADFISTLIKAFGLSLFVNPSAHTAQLNLFDDTLRAAAFDITEWVTRSEFLGYKPKTYEVSLTPTLDADNADESATLPDVNSRDSLPSVIVNKNKHAFVASENAFRRADIDSEKNKYSWVQQGGSARPLKAGANNAETTEAISLDINTPNMVVADEDNGLDIEEKMLCQVEVEGCSPMLDEEFKGEFPLILQQYNGYTSCPGTGAFIESANPTRYASDGTRLNALLQLSATGSGSIGEVYTRSVFDLLGNADQFRFEAHMPTWAFIKTMALLQPQTVSATEQVRWIQVGGQRYLPTKISYEFGRRSTALVTIECVRKHVEF